MKDFATSVPPTFANAGGTPEPKVYGLEALTTVREAAALLRVRPVTIYRMVARGELAHVRISNAIRIPRASLDALL